MFRVLGTVVAGNASSQLFWQSSQRRRERMRHARRASVDRLRDHAVSAFSFDHRRQRVFVSLADDKIYFPISVARSFINRLRSRGNREFLTLFWSIIRACSLFFSISSLSLRASRIETIDVRGISSSLLSIREEINRVMMDAQTGMVDRQSSRDLFGGPSPRQSIDDVFVNNGIL